MRSSLIACLTLLCACGHGRVPAPAGRTAAAATLTEASALCSGQRAENRRRAETSRCTADEDCVQAGQYETGTCDAWVTGPDAEHAIREMREATEVACRDVDRIVVRPACWPMAGACVSGRCAAARATSNAVLGVAALPEDPRCVADALMRVRSENELPPGRVELRFPLSVDGSPPRYFEAVGPVDPDAAVGLARAYSSCRWRLQTGDVIPPGTWGTITIGLREQP